MAAASASTSGATDQVPETRRARLRRELTAEILRVARHQLTVAGPGGVSWRGIAREVGMNPASLYTYFNSVDDLFTALIIESYGSLARSVQTAYDDGPTDDALERAMGCVRAYADWGRSQPAEFNLIFVDQLPGYAAPEGGPTVLKGNPNKPPAKPAKVKK